MCTPYCPVVGVSDQQLVLVDVLAANSVMPGITCIDDRATAVHHVYAVLVNIRPLYVLGAADRYFVVAPHIDAAMIHRDKEQVS